MKSLLSIVSTAYRTKEIQIQLCLGRDYRKNINTILRWSRYIPLAQVPPDSCTKFWQKPGSVWASNGYGTVQFCVSDQSQSNLVAPYRFKCRVVLYILSDQLKVQHIRLCSSEWINDKYLCELCLPLLGNIM